MTGCKDRDLAKDTLRTGISPKDAVQALTALYLCTAKAGQTIVEMEGVLVLYSREVCQWPAAVVKSVLEEYPRKNKFWPALAELVSLFQLKELELVSALKAEIDTLNRSKNTDNRKELTVDFIDTVPPHMLVGLQKWFCGGAGARLFIDGSNLCVETDALGCEKIPSTYGMMLKTYSEKKGLKGFYCKQVAA